ncbi:MAG: creatininase family protein [Oscillatoriales cyanobacterium SM2_2_1]|nr:creatininase family protein [Oscillatoriales cyanobacterium SM2_2_1]
MLLHLSTWPEIEAYLGRSRGIVIPIGSTEQHGPTGLIGTDFICAEMIARGIGQERDALIASTLTIGMAEHHLAFPGTISLRPATLIAVVKDYLHSLGRHGFERFFFVNGHGGNISILRTAFSEIYTELPQVRCRLANWWMSHAVQKLVQEFYGDREGMHATPSEVAVTMYAYPQSIKIVPLDPIVKTDGRIYSAADFRQRYPDGRMGSDPSIATIEQGQVLYEHAVRELARQYDDFLRED